MSHKLTSGKLMMGKFKVCCLYYNSSNCATEEIE